MDIASTTRAAENRTRWKWIIVESFVMPQRWMDGWIAILRPFRQYFNHMRTMGG